MAKQLNDSRLADALRESLQARPTAHNPGCLGGNPKQPLRIALVSEDPVLGALVQQAPQCVSGNWRVDTIAGIPQILEHTPLAAPDVALIDISAPGTAGLDGVCSFHAALPAVPVVVISASKAPRDVFSALAAQACGYVVKPAKLSEITRAVLGAYVGLRTLCSQTEEIVLYASAPPRPCASRADDLLTPRQQSIMACLAAGYSNKAIAQTLGISPRTVEAHINNILHKLDVNSRAKAVAKYYS